MGMIKDKQKLRAELEALSEAQKVDLILHLMDLVSQATSQVERLTARVAELEARLGMSSVNSSKPPSSDGDAKPSPKSLRQKSGRKPGGQPGHAGTHLQQACAPDEIVVCAPRHCTCGFCLDGVEASSVERRQVFDLVKKLMGITEYRIVTAKCPQCGRLIRAEAPPGVSGPAQYGPRFRGMLVYLRDYQLLPYGRLTRLCRDLLGAGVCKRTVETAQACAHDALLPFEQAVRGRLLDEAVLHADETGMRVEGKLQWFHSLSSAGLTLYQAHPRRGGEAIEANGVIPAFDGTLVHDCWRPYFQYGGGHALCGAHLLRELAGVHENEGHRWALEMSVLLGAVAETVAARGAEPPSAELADWFGQTYDDILARGEPELPAPKKTPGKRGRPKNAKSANLHRRLADHRDAVLLCLRDPAVPFTNNRAEQDIRMVKLRQKISGCARTLAGAQIFARIRGYISTSRKHGKDIFQNLVDAIAGSPWMPPPNAPTP